MNTHKVTKPWHGTERIMRKYLERAIPYLTGKLLDAGCGRQRFKSLFNCDSYIGMEYNSDFNPDVVGDLRNMPFSDDEFDSILNNQVLEHIDDTHAVFSEFSRVLKPGGYLCLTVPFISRVHGRPHDYWRFSEYGLRHLFDKYGFEVVEISGMGGFLTAQTYLWQFFIWDSLARGRIRRLLRAPLMVIGNVLMPLAHWLDWDKNTPFNYFAIARKQ